jgi:uncharacterized protein (DUF433 family)
MWGVSAHVTISGKSNPRNSMKHERITVDPALMVGKPCIKGTRITVEQILRELGAGWSFDEVIDAHPILPSKTSMRLLITRRM